MSSAHDRRAVPRLEDARFIEGRSRYVEDLQVEGCLRAVFVRAPIAHARITGIDTAAAAACPGVVAVWTAADLSAELPAPGRGQAVPGRPLLARDVVRFAGEAVAVVVASSLATAQDAAEQVLADYDPLPVVTDPEAALAAGAPVLFDELDDNVVASDAHEDADALADAEVTVRGRFVNQRLAPVPLETNALLCAPGDDGASLTVWVSTQVPFRMRDDLARVVGLDADAVRVVAPDVGGAFGAKLACLPEHAAVATAAMRLGRPVRWAETRSESMVSMTHGRGHVQDVEVGATRDGVITGLRIDLLADCGAYPTGAGMMMPRNTYVMACGAYRIPRVDFRVRGVVTNTTPIAAYRGAGRPEATALVERAVDLLAAELGLDPVELRRRNLLEPADFPHTTATGAVYDSGDYQRALEEALRVADYQALRREQAERRAAGSAKLLGVGVSTYVEVTGRVSREHGEVEIRSDGRVIVRTGISPQGQGHETMLAQVVGDLLRVGAETIDVVHSDTAAVAEGRGTMGSRATQIGGSAVLRAGQEVVEKGRRLVAHLLEAAEHDVAVLDGGLVGVTGSPETALSWAALAAIAEDPDQLPEGAEPGLRAALSFDQGAGTFPFGTHVAAVDVDADTGMVAVVRYVAVDDAGTIVNPLLADGQTHGGLAQGIAQALYEEVVYDEHGNPRTASLVDYLVPGAPDLPCFEVVRTETPTPLNPLGAKGLGEAATIGSVPAVWNAVIDALSHRGVRHLDLPLTPERVWRALNAGG